MSKEPTRPMTREEYERVANLVDDEALLAPLGVQEHLWNLAMKHAARVVRRAGYEATWAAPRTKAR